MPRRKYASYKPMVLPAPRPTDRFATINPPVRNVLKEYDKIRVDGDYLRVHDGNQIPEMRYTANVDNKLGLGNHFQGIQRLKRGRYIVISGGDPHTNQDHKRASHLFVIKLGSRPPGTGPWGSNVIRSRVPNGTDKIVRTIGIDRQLWHAGGISVCGDILAVPVESNQPEKSRIVFYNMRDPEKPRQFLRTVNRAKTKAGAVALTRLSNGYYLLAVWSDSDSKPRRLEFYLSQSTNFLQGFKRDPVTWYATDVQAGTGQDPNFSNFQTVNFINQSDGGLFLVGLHNTSDAAPTTPGRDYADLYSVTFGDGLSRATPQLSVPTITKIAKRQFFCNDQQANMDAAAGVYIDPKGALSVYAAWHWRSTNLLRFNEYRCEPAGNAPAITKISEAWVDMYEHTRYAGRRLSIVGKRAGIKHFGNISVQGWSFEDMVSSAQWQIPKGYNYVLYKHRNYEGEALVLHGTGKVVKIPSLKHKDYDFNDTVSSARYEKA